MISVDSTSKAPTPSGRPLDGEFAPYAKGDIDRVPGDDAVAALAAQLPETLALLTPVGEEFASSFAYAPGKWPLKQVVGHLADDERIFAYRALCVARGDPAPLPGFDEEEYIRFAGFEERSWADLLAEYRTVRKATLAGSLPKRGCGAETSTGTRRRFAASRSTSPATSFTTFGQ